MPLDLYNKKTSEQMRCGFFWRKGKLVGFIGVESTMNPTLRGFYTFTDMDQVKELRTFLEEWEKEYKEKNERTTSANSA